jgi:hypothetical protein
MPSIRIILTSLFALGIASCSSDKKPAKSKATPEPTQPAPKKTPTASVGKALADGPRTIERTELASIVRKGQDGETRTWMSLAGFTVSDVDYRERYQSRGEHFVSFKAALKGGKENCLVHWKAEFIKSDTGRGPSLGKLEGTVPVAAEATVMASGIGNFETAVAKEIGSATVGYWSLCGDALPTPSVFDMAITETAPEQIKFGTSFDLHHTRLAITSNIAPSSKEPERCYFELVVEDVDKDGFTLNRDFASFSMRPGAASGASMRRTTFEGGNQRDYSDLAVSKQSYLRKLVCKGPWSPTPDSISGIKITNLKALPYEGEPTTAEQHVRATFGHSATFANETGKDCSFRIRYRMLDKDGMPLNRSPVLSETVHLHRGAQVDYTSEKQRLFVWLKQANDVGSLAIEQAAPVQNCAAFDAARALQAVDKTGSSGGN